MNCLMCNEESNKKICGNCLGRLDKATNPPKIIAEIANHF